MIPIVFENKAAMWQYIIFMTGFALLLSLSLIPVVHADIAFVILFSVGSSALLAITGIMLVLTVRYGKFGNLPAFQRIINYVALLLLHVGVTLLGVYGLAVLLFQDKADSLILPLIPLLGLVVFLSALLYVLYSGVKYAESIKQITPDSGSEVVDELEEVIQQTEIIERIAVKSGSKIHVIMTPDIICLQADGDYVQIFTLQGKYLKEQTMKYFEEHLPANSFVRVHRSCIVNVEAISRIDLYEKQTQQLTLKNGQQIKVSQSGYKLLRSKLAL